MKIKYFFTKSSARTTAMLFIAALVLSAFITGMKDANAQSLPNTGAPAGFALTKVAGGFTAPVAADTSPDGRIFVIEKGGSVKIIKNGEVLAQPFFVVPNVNDYVDRGLLGIAIDPDFATNGYVYLLYTYDNNPSDIAGPKTGQLLRVTAQGDIAVPGSQQVILGSVVGDYAQRSCMDFPVNTDCLAADGLSHAPGSVVFAPDGKLFVSLGDASGYDDIDINALRAQDVNSLAGKILRINKDGTAPTDNPFYNGNPNDNRSKVYALGLRNPFRITVRETDGLLVAGDVGWNTWEEVNVITPGANLGWPCYEATDQQNGTGAPNVSAYKNLPQCQQLFQNTPQNLVFPLLFYPHPPSSAVVSGEFYEASAYPVEYKGTLFYGDYARDQIYTLKLGQDNTLIPNSNQVFATNVGGSVGFLKGLNGDIYYLAVNLGAMYKIEYSTENRAPEAFASVDPNFGPSPLVANFSSSGSFDPDGDNLSYEWEFGDGSPLSTEANPVHTYAADGTYVATLKVFDVFNNSVTKTVTVSVGQTPPEVTIASPADMIYATPEQIIQFSGSASDAQDGAIPANNLNWQVSIQHCPLDSCHVHNVMTVSGAGGSFQFPNHDGPFYIQLTLTVTDSSGLTNTKSISVYPDGQEITHSMKFDGINDYAIAASPQDFRLQQFTAEAMVKTLSTDDWGSEVLSAGNNWSVRINPNGNVQFSFNSNYMWQNLIATNVNVKDGLWHHVAVTRTANAMKIYVDGKIKAQSENVNQIEYVYGGDFVVGRHGDGDDHFNFNGSIDEVRVWPAPRTDAQIDAYDSTTLMAGETNLLMHIAAEEGTGVIAADTSQAATHGLTLRSGATWTAGAPLASPIPPVATVPISSLTDTFTGATIDPSKWYIYEPTTQTVQDDLLTITPTTTTTGYYGISSKQLYDIKNSSVYVQVPQVTSVSTSAETQFIAEFDTDNSLTVGQSNGSLYLRHRSGGVNSDTYIPYSATTMQWWRIREAGNVIHFETSADSITWTAHRSVAVSFDTTKLRIILQAGTWQALAQPGTASFDNLNVPTPPLPPTPVDKAMSLTGQASSQAAIISDHGHYAYQDLTMEAWAKVQSTGLYGGEIISNGNNAGLRITADGNLRFFMHTGNLVWLDHETTGLNLKDNVWHHLAATKDATNVKLYVDGVLVKTVATTDVISYTLGQNVIIGRHGDGDNNFNLTGNIDEIRIWNLARTAAQINENYTVELIAPITGLQGYWKMNEANGSAIEDASGGGHPIVMSIDAVLVNR